MILCDTNILKQDQRFTLGKGIITALRLPDNETRLIVRTTMYFYGPEKEEAVYSIWQGFQKELEKLGLIAGPLLLS